MSFGYFAPPTEDIELEKNSGIFNISYYGLNDNMYAFTNLTNVFHLPQYFEKNISAYFLNGYNLATVYFNYLTDLSSNVQEQINNIMARVFGVNYDSNTNTTLINNNLVSVNSSSQSSSQINSAIANTLTANKINNFQITTNNIFCNDLESNTIFCNKITSYNDIGVYIFINGIVYPLIKSQLISNFLPSYSISNSFFHIKPNYKLELVDKNNFVIYTFENITQDILYNKNFVYDYKDTLGTILKNQVVDLTNIIYFNIYLNNIQLL